MIVLKNNTFTNNIPQCFINRICKLSTQSHTFGFPNSSAKGSIIRENFFPYMVPLKSETCHEDYSDRFSIRGRESLSSTAESIANSCSWISSSQFSRELK